MQAGALDASLTGSLAAAFDVMKSNASALAKEIGVSAQALGGFSEQIRVKLVKDEEENQRLIEQAVVAVGESMVRHLIPNISDNSKESETASETLERLATSLAVANCGLKLLDMERCCGIR